MHLHRLLSVLLLVCLTTLASGLPEGFVDLEESAPEIRVELRYCGSDNFVGGPVDGYEKPRCLMTRPTAVALKSANAQLKPFGLGLKVFDAYRPQRAVDHFARWARDVEDTRTKARYYPDVAKTDLFAKGYIAEKSGHSRGSTVDVTLVALADGKEIDMGTPWDLFGPASWPTSTAFTAQQRANRLLLREIMTHHGFLPLEEEWWHFTLKDEPFPDTYFNFPIR